MTKGAAVTLSREALELLKDDPAALHLYAQMAAEAAEGFALVPFKGRIVPVWADQLPFNCRVWAGKIGLTEGTIKTRFAKLQRHRLIASERHGWGFVITMTAKGKGAA